MIDGSSKNKWFRPSDVCVAPDGTLIVADWYDPGVGGHRMRDVERGRLFRITSKGASKDYRCKDDCTAEELIVWLNSPNQSRRCFAWQMISGLHPPKVVESVWDQWRNHANPRFRVRAMWLLGHITDDDEKLNAIVDRGLASDNPNIRIATIRFCRRFRKKLSFEEVQSKFNLRDPSPEVRREIAVGLREMQPANLATQWSELAKQHDGVDRWYLEALGIAAEGHWDACLELLEKAYASGQIRRDAYCDLVWRSRGERTPTLLAEIIRDSSVTGDGVLRYFRAFDFALRLGNESTQRAANVALNTLAFSDIGTDAKSKVVFRESTKRFDLGDLSPKQLEQVENIISNCSDEEFVGLALKFGNDQRDKKLIRIAQENADSRLGGDAMATLLRRKKPGLVIHAMRLADDNQFERYVEALVRCGVKQGGHVLAGYSDRKEFPMERRAAAVRALGRTSNGSGDLLWRVQNNKNDPDLEPVIAATLHSSSFGWVRDSAAKYFPAPASKSQKPMPPIKKLVKRTGDTKHGQEIFAGIGTCAKCHIVNGVGVEIGPNLSEIGDKLSRESMYESILFPSAGISHNYENWLVATEDGQIISGLLLSKTDTVTTIKDIDGVTHEIQATDIEEQKKLKLSLMPADLVKEFSEQDLVDLVEYLMTLRKAK